MEYRCLQKQTYHIAGFSIEPIRSKDKYDIMQWRNDQLYHLRQQKPLTEKEQDEYFENVISKLFSQEKPGQVLFSYIQDNVCIGYGGLVHINWVDKNAEISFVMNTSLEKHAFETHWTHFISLVEEVAFKELKFHKIFTYAFDVRQHLYKAVEKAGYKKEAVLKEHCLFEGKFIDVIIHSKWNRDDQI
jgi:RimJ/RimL family protein N-acetyltransferase